MSKVSIIFCAFFLIAFLFSFVLKAEEVNSKIDAVTVYINGAQITRKANTTLKPGSNTIEFKGISPYINTQSLSVKGLGNFKILSTAVKRELMIQKLDTINTDSLSTVKRKIKKQLNQLKARLEVLKKIEILVESNNNLSNEENVVSAENLKAMMNLYKTDLLPVRMEGTVISEKLDSLNNIESKVILQIANLKSEGQPEKVAAKKIIIVEVEAKSADNATFEISYFTDGANWFPSYDIRVDDLSKPIELIAKANISQSTGEDWENVQLTFSSGEPNVGGVAPELQPWYLRYGSRNYSYKNNGLYNPSIRQVTGRVIDGNFKDPLPGVNVIIEGTTIGTVTDIDGFYTINVPIGKSQLVFSYVGMNTQSVTISKPVMNIELESGALLDEVVVTGTVAGRDKRKNSIKEEREEAEYVVSTAEQTPTVLTFKVEERFNIPSKNESKTINLSENKIDATYTHYTVPKLENTAYLIASINNWSRYNLLQGEANIYFENTFITETIIDAQGFNDTLSISLGPDRNIAIKRVKDEDFCKTKMLSSNVNQSIGFNIDIRNNRKQQINLECYDQIPVSEIDDIKVKVDNISNGSLNEKTGIIKWKFPLMPNENKQLQLGYEVKYPKGKQVVLE